VYLYVSFGRVICTTVNPRTMTFDASLDEPPIIMSSKIGSTDMVGE